MFIRLIGDFRMLDAAGSDATPSAARARALLAILARTEGHKRPRRWLERCLWSERGPEQAAGSLRQVLTEIRKTLGDSAEVFGTDREYVWLTGVATDLDDDPGSALAAMREGRDLLEDLRIPDPAFETWRDEERRRVLRELEGQDRSLVHPAPASEDIEGRPLEIRVKAYGEKDPETGAFIGSLLGDTIAGLIADFGCFDIVSAPRPTPNKTGLVLGLRTLTIGDKVQVLAGLTAQDTGELIWSQTARLDTAAPDLLDQGDLPDVLFHSAARVLTQKITASADAALTLRVDGLVNAATAAMFTYEPARLRQAETLMSEAYALMPLPRIAAWRSLVRQIMIVERTEPDTQELYEEAHEFARIALEGNDGNALVMSLVAQLLAMLENDTGVSAVLAEDAVRASPYNAFSHAARATVALRAGQTAAALEAGRRAAKLASRSPSAHWFDTVAGLSAIAAGDIDEAVTHYERAHARAPHFRAPMRHLLCLYAARGEHERCAEMADSLKRVEPDFDVMRIRDDETYPVFTLRRSNLLPSRRLAEELAAAPRASVSA